MHTAPTYLKWALVFEEPDARRVCLGKALPREWLAAGATPVVVRRATTRYGRVSYSLVATSSDAAAVASPGGEGASAASAAYTVRANVTLPATYGATHGPSGGVQLRLRTPTAHVGKLSAVTVGGKPWTAFDAKAETITFELALLTPELLDAMQTIVASYD